MIPAIEVNLIFIMMITAIVVAFGLTAIFVKQFCKPGSFMHLLDHPNHRSLHTHPTPRSGGVAIILGILLSLPFWLLAIGPLPEFMLWLAVAVLIVALLAFFDDRSGVPVGPRLTGHVIAAVLVVVGADTVFTVSLPGVHWQLSAWLGIPIAILFLVWMTNLYNFMDGMDGFAGGMSVFGFTALALAGKFADAKMFMTINFVFAAAAGGFLVFNFPPARIFMGDTGSSTLGFVAGAMLLWAETSGIMPIWLGIVIFSPFIIDATVTLLRRITRRERIWQAHKSHYYQRLVQIGWGHRKTVLVEYFLMLICAILALVALHASTVMQLLILAFIIALYVLFIYGVNKLEPAL